MHAGAGVWLVVGWWRWLVAGVGGWLVVGGWWLVFLLVVVVVVVLGVRVVVVLGVRVVRVLVLLVLLVSCSRSSPCCTHLTVAPRGPSGARRYSSGRTRTRSTHRPAPSSAGSRTGWTAARSLACQCASPAPALQKPAERPAPTPPPPLQKLSEKRAQFPMGGMERGERPGPCALCRSPSAPKGLRRSPGQ